MKTKQTDHELIITSRTPAVSIVFVGCAIATMVAAYVKRGDSTNAGALWGAAGIVLGVLLR